MNPIAIMQAMALLFLLLFGKPALAQTVPAGEALRIDTRPGVSVPIYAYWRDDAAATVVLFSGGGGGYGKIGEDGWPTGGNFLIRTGKRWAQRAFNVVMVGRPSDGMDLSYGRNRTGDEHAADNLAIFRAVKAKSAAPLWLVGNSMGTISAAAATIRDQDKLLAGIVLTSSILAYKVPGAVPTQALDRIRVPVLMVHHEQDACWACRPYEIGNMAGALTGAPVKKTIMVSGGEGAAGDPCEPMHHHGFVGMREEVVDMIAAWIMHPAD